MSDYSELKRLAEAATPGPWQTELEYPIIQPAYPARGSIASALIWQDANFISAANPAAVLALIAEVERLKVDLREQKDAKLGLSWAIGEIMGECDQLKAEVERLNSDNASLRGSCAKLGVDHAGMVRIHRKANTEIRRLSAEVEALHKDADRFRFIEQDASSGMSNIYGDDWLEVVDQLIGMGDKS